MEMVLATTPQCLKGVKYLSTVFWWVETVMTLRLLKVRVCMKSVMELTMIVT